ncbi:MAG: adenylosuccinate lyase [Chloroflexi bacterium]|nr:adenylosuccinate lyase [Chloroflexota bacterium]MDA1226538.1 adenylosuccinate lyase [Chloroflexota bacterium]
MSIRALTPLDGRYASQVVELADYLSEWALIKYRVLVEVEWLIEMAASQHISNLRELTTAEIKVLRQLSENFDDKAALRAKEIEGTTRHDVKAVEYLIREQLEGTSLEDVSEWIHFCCTSEDINNLSYALMLKDALEQVWLPAAQELVSVVASIAQETREIPLLARTHGQPASPTTLGKELAVFVHRWQRQLKQIGSAEYLGKFNGAVGSYNAHAIAYPEAPWEDISSQFVERLGLTHNPLTTQIETHDFLAEIFHAMTRFNTVTVDFDKDIWTYISLGVFKQTVVEGEVGSSTMPHKVNPINFENSEANMGISNALLEHLASKLLVSRLQRDLTDSSALRNLGPAIGHSLVGLKSAMRGLRQIAVDEALVRAELAGSWEVLAEAVQTVMRKHGIGDAYEQLKNFSRGAAIDREGMQGFIKSLDLPEDDKKRLLVLTPETYTGIASDLVRHISEG